jgi:hypothetical protein
MLKRTFLEWRKLQQERWWKNQYSMRDETIHMLEVCALHHPMICTIRSNAS